VIIYLIFLKDIYQTELKTVKQISFSLSFNFLQLPSYLDILELLLFCNPVKKDFIFLDYYKTVNLQKDLYFLTFFSKKF
jgi:hypothetical protein